MYQRRVGILGAKLVVDGTATGHTSLTVTGRVDLAVGVIHCDNHQVLGAQGGEDHQCAQAQQHEITNLCHNRYLVLVLFFQNFKIT